MHFLRVRWSLLSCCFHLPFSASQLHSNLVSCLICSIIWFISLWDTGVCHVFCSAQSTLSIDFRAACYIALSLYPANLADFWKALQWELHGIAMHASFSTFSRLSFVYHISGRANLSLTGLLLYLGRLAEYVQDFLCTAQGGVLFWQPFRKDNRHESSFYHPWELGWDPLGGHVLTVGAPTSTSFPLSS